MRSQIDVKLTYSNTVQPECCNWSDEFFPFFLNRDWMVQSKVECWVDNLRLHYNSSTKTTRNSKGVETMIPDFGDPEVVDELDSVDVRLFINKKKKKTFIWELASIQQKTYPYFNELSNFLEKHGYVRKSSLRSAPYDFRKGPSKFMNNLTSKLFKSLCSALKHWQKWFGRCNLIVQKSFTWFSVSVHLKMFFFFSNVLDFLLN